MFCIFTYSMRYEGYTLSFDKAIDLPAFPHRQMMIIDGDVEISLEDQPELHHHTYIAFDVKKRKTSVCVSDSIMNCSMEVIKEIINTLDEEGWERDFDDKQLSSLEKLINRKNKETKC